MTSRFHRKRSGFSLVELLTVLGITGLLLSLILPAIQRSREAAARVQCQNNQRQVAVALHHFHASNGRLPPLRKQPFPPDALSLLSWMTAILPELEEDSLHVTSLTACNLDPSCAFTNPPHVGLAKVIRTYVCQNDARLLSPQTTPAGDVVAHASYVGVGGSFDNPLPNPGVPRTYLARPGAFSDAPGCRLSDFHDGTSNTVMVGERPPPESLQAGRWYCSSSRERFAGPDLILFVPTLPRLQDYECAGAGSRRFGPGRADNPCDRFHFWSLHPGGGNFLFADGSVRFLTHKIEPMISALSTRSGGEVIELPE